MHTRFKTRRTAASPLALRIVSCMGAFILASILFAPNALSQAGSPKLEMSAADLARKVVTNELKVQDQDHSHWMYRLEKEESGTKRAQEIIETSYGSLSRLLSIDGHPLDAKQQRKEDRRIQSLVSHPDEQRTLQQASAKKAEQGTRLFRILPDVFVFSYSGRRGNLVTLTFSPNPTFQPTSLDAWVFHSMEGKMTADIKQERLVALSGHLMRDVNFGARLLGHLDKGGKFEVRQTEVAPGQWEITSLNVDMKGKAFLFKTINVQETEDHSDFHGVPDDLTLAGAVAILNRQIVVAENR